ncbi:MAG: 2,3-bisphosphoglycerate-independent phosphoglycerate mutase [bacterium]
MLKSPRPVLLIILDGWGYSPSSEWNAIAQARTPHWDRLLREYPHTLVHTSGERVGLPAGLMGNSEVGHLNIGAGRTVYQEITRINASIVRGEFFRHPLLRDVMTHARKSRLHLLGLLSDGGVHSHLEHIYALLKTAKENGVSEVFIHAFLDGRDTAPTKGAEYLAALEQKMKEYGVGEVASVSGRYYAMDRDKRWDRVQKAYDAMVLGEGVRADNSAEAVRASYEKGITDEVIHPIVLTNQTGEPRGTIREDDAVLFFNFRADRARQMTRALTHQEFDGFPRRGFPARLFFATMTRYDRSFTLPYLFPPRQMGNILANVFTERHIKNLRVAETEKYAHVTYFFNGGEEKTYPGEDRILVPSPKVATYDLKPEMSAQGITETVVKFVEEGSRDAIILNFANADMVGHSGKIEAAVKAVETVDAGLGGIYQAVRRRGGAMMITADHGNAEQMRDPVTGGPHTAHTTNPVPLVLVAEEAPEKLQKGGALGDIAPTFLGLLRAPQPKEMSGRDLLLPQKKQAVPST